MSGYIASLAALARWSDNRMEPQKCENIWGWEEDVSVGWWKDDVSSGIVTTNR